MKSPLKLARSFSASIPPIFYGLALCYTWFSMLIDQQASSGQLPSYSLPILFDGGICAVYLVALAGIKLTFRPGFLRFCSSTSALLCIVSTALHVTSFSNFTSSPLVASIALLLGGAGFSLATLVWKSLYCPFSPAQVTLLFVGSKFLSGALAIALDGYNEAYFTIALIVVCCAGAALLQKAVASASSSWGDFSGKLFPPIAKLILMCVVYGIAYGYGASNHAEGLSGRISDALFCLGLLATFFLWPRLDFVFLYHIALPVLIAALLLFPAIPGLPPLISQSAIRISYTIVLIYITVILCNICRKNSVNPAPSFCLAGLAVHLSIRTGGVLAYFIEQQVQGPMFNEGVLVAVLVGGATITSLIILSERPFSPSWSLVKAGSAQQDIIDQANTTVIRQWKTSYGLTTREQELLDALVRGLSVDDIANEFFISKGTVKAHIQHIYRKVDVHSRTELLARFRDASGRA